MLPTVVVLHRFADVLPTVVCIHMFADIIPTVVVYTWVCLFDTISGGVHIGLMT